MKTREIANTPEKGQKRYRLYKDVIDRYKKAIKDGFYLEAITLMESVITDRLESTLIYNGLLSPDNAFKTLERCLKQFNESQGLISDDLFNEIKAWKDGRNHALHEMAKIEEGDDSTFEQRYAEQKRIAEQGYEIFKSIKKETR